MPARESWRSVKRDQEQPVHEILSSHNAVGQINDAVQTDIKQVMTIQCHH